MLWPVIIVLLACILSCCCTKSTTEHFDYNTAIVDSIRDDYKQAVLNMWVQVEMQLHATYGYIHALKHNDGIQLEPLTFTPEIVTGSRQTIKDWIDNSHKAMLSNFGTANCAHFSKFWDVTHETVENTLVIHYTFDGIVTPFTV